LSVWVDLDSEQLTCLRWTSSAGFLFQNPCENAGLLEWIDPKEKQSVLHWLKAVTGSVEPSRRIALRLPSQGGSEQRRAKLKKRYFLCSVFTNDEELPETTFPQGVRVGQLNLYEVKTKEMSKSRHKGKQTHTHILIWIDVRTHVVLKTLYAPRALFEEDSLVMIHQEANQEDDATGNFFQRVNSAIINSGSDILEEKFEPVFLGPYTLVSNSYMLYAQTTIVDYGENLQGTARGKSWFLLRLEKFRLLG